MTFTTSTPEQTSFNAKSAVIALIATTLMSGTMMANAASSDDADSTPSTTQKVESSVNNATHKTERVASDSWITTKVKSEILANSVSKAFEVSVTTKHGAVALQGKLPNQDAIDLVKMIAEKVKGVKSVDTSGLVVG